MRKNLQVLCALAMMLAASMFHLSGCTPDDSTVESLNQAGGIYCTNNAQCGAGKYCFTNTHQCYPVQCLDGFTSGGESDLNCGGPCPPCAVGKHCNVDANCVSDKCTDGTCENASCAVDAECLVNKGRGCIQGHCYWNTCRNNFWDNGVQQPSEHNPENDIDCGADGECPPCAVGKLCAGGGLWPPGTIDSDCASGWCNTQFRCEDVVCANGVKDGLETDVDCGGFNSCSRCETNQRCNGNSDCMTLDSLRCLLTNPRVCSWLTCPDGFKNGQETDVDCGGGNCPGCGQNKACNQRSDCAPGLCCSGLGFCVLCKAPGEDCGLSGEFAQLCASGSCYHVNNCNAYFCGYRCN